MKRFFTVEFDPRGRMRIDGDPSEEDPDGPPFEFKFPESVAAACTEVLKGRRTFRIGQGLATDPTTHPDSAIILKWTKDQREFGVLIWLAACVIAEWDRLPHRTRAQHRELFQRIGRLCRELHAALDETGDSYYRGGGYGLANANVRDLMTDREEAEFMDICAFAHMAQFPGTQVERISVNEPGLPRVDDLLERVESAAARLEKQGPMHSQPTKRGAKRGYFVRRMGELMKQRHGEQPHEVIAALTTIALGEATDRELVAKLLA